VHFLPIQINYSLDKLAQIYIRKIVQIHVVLETFVLDKDLQFLSNVWVSFSKALGTKLYPSTATHSQTDGQSERTIQILEDMLKACMLDVGDNWEKYIPLVMFACNNSYQLTFGMQPLKLSMVGSVSPPIIGKRLENEDYWALI